MSVPFPSLFVSHGAPDLVLGDSPARRFLAGLAASMPRRPRAILMVSAHWETAVPTLSLAAEPATIHDFGGFDPSLYTVHYPASGAPDVARQAATLLERAGFAAALAPDRGLDHGAWVPLSLIFPDGDVPVTQLSVQPAAGPAHHLAVGAALAPLRDDVIIIASGSYTHDLRSYLPFRHQVDAPEPDWVTAFAAWFADALARGDREALLDYRARAPHAVRNHPTEEHLLPLYVALGAAGADALVERLHQSATHGVLRMDAFAFRSGA